jgi:hypothetical protein
LSLLSQALPAKDYVISVAIGNAYISSSTASWGKLHEIGWGSSRCLDSTGGMQKRFIRAKRKRGSQPKRSSAIMLPSGAWGHISSPSSPPPSRQSCARRPSPLVPAAELCAEVWAALRGPLLDGDLPKYLSVCCSLSAERRISSSITYVPKTFLPTTMPSSICPFSSGPRRASILTPALTLPMRRDLLVEKVIVAVLCDGIDARSV